jgi:tRNA A37 methylthiotransferase MiaB
MKKVQPDIVNVSRFFPRPGTRAEKMERFDDQEVNYRSQKLTELVRKLSLERNIRWLNWEGEVFVDEKGKNSSWIGRNFAYKPIAIRSNYDLFGKFVRIKVVKAYSTYLEAEVINES